MVMACVCESEPCLTGMFDCPVVQDDHELMNNNPFECQAAAEPTVAPLSLAEIDARLSQYLAEHVWDADGSLADCRWVFHGSALHHLAALNSLLGVCLLLGGQSHVGTSVLPPPGCPTIDTYYCQPALEAQPGARPVR